MDGDDIPGWGGTATFATLESEGNFSVKRICEQLLKYHEAQIALENNPEADPSTLEYKDSLSLFYLDKQVHLFDFLLQLTAKEEPLHKSLELLRRISTNQLPKFNTIQELLLTTDLTPAKAWLEEELDLPQGLSKAEHFQAQMTKYLKLYPAVVSDLSAKAEELESRLKSIGTIDEKLKIIDTLPSMEAKSAIVESMKAYIQEVSKEFEFEIHYNAYIFALQKLYVVQNVLWALRATQNEHLIPLCMVCFINPVESTLIPCGHTFCRDCIKKAIGGLRSCFCCRASVISSQRIYFS